MTDHYAYRITWSPEDGAHSGRCAEFPSLSWLARTPGEALSEIQALVASVLADMQANGESPPKPLADRAEPGHSSEASTCFTHSAGDSAPVFNRRSGRSGGS